MGAGIVVTKLSPPRASGAEVVRARLMLAPDALAARSLVSIVAPAGAGKTTLLRHLHAAWQADGRAAAWVSLDAADDDPVRFLRLLVLALAPYLPEAGRPLQAFLETAARPRAEDAFGAVLNGLLDRDAPLAVFIDDLQLLTDAHAWAGLRFMLRYLPASITMVVGSRHRLPFVRLKLRGRLRELGWEDLSFTVAETETYLREVHALQLPEARYRDLAGRTEGWAAGLQLLALSGALDASPDGAGAIAHHFDTFLLDDVLARQTPDLRRFLLETAVLERFSAPLCAAVTGLATAGAAIDELRRKNLFVFALDGEARWYRFHHLFVEFLRARLAAEDPGASARVTLAASRWFEAQGSDLDALDYAMRGRHLDRAAWLLERAGPRLFRRGAFKELLARLDRLPEDVLSAHPALLRLHGWASAYAGQFFIARHYAALAEHAGRRDGALTAGVAAECDVLHNVLAVIQTDEPDLDRDYGHLEDAFDPEDWSMRAFAQVVLGYVARARGALAQSVTHSRRAAALAAMENGSLVTLLAHFCTASSLYLMGRLDAAAVEARGALDLAGQRHWLTDPAAAFLRVVRAVLLGEQARPEAALTELDIAISVLDACGAFGFLGVALVEKARMDFACGHDDCGARALTRARRLADDHNIIRVAFRADLLAARRATDAGEWVTAETLLDRWAGALDAHEIPEDAPVSERAEFLWMDRLRLLAARGERAAVGRDGARLKAAMTRGDRALHRLEVDGLIAWAEQGVENPQAVRAALMAQGRRAVLARLDALFGGRSAVTSVTGSAAPVARRPQLHYREHQILRLVDKGLRNRDIAARLDLSVETVKWYLKSLYEKLQVANRTEAVAVARLAGLL